MSFGGPVVTKPATNEQKEETYELPDDDEEAKNHIVDAQWISRYYSF